MPSETSQPRTTGPSTGPPSPLSTGKNRPPHTDRGKIVLSRAQQPRPGRRRDRTSAALGRRGRRQRNFAGGNQLSDQRHQTVERFGRDELIAESVHYHTIKTHNRISAAMQAQPRQRLISTCMEHRHREVPFRTTTSQRAGRRTVSASRPPNSPGAVRQSFCAVNKGRRADNLSIGAGHCGQCGPLQRAALTGRGAGHDGGQRTPRERYQPCPRRQRTAELRSAHRGAPISTL